MSTVSATVNTNQQVKMLDYRFISLPIYLVERLKAIAADVA